MLFRSPLSLGGANGFEVMVDGSLNSKIGSEIDGVFSSDLTIAMKRQKFDAVGHSKKRPKVTIKKANINSTGQRVQVSLDRKTGMKVWDPVESRYLSDKETAGQEISLNFSMKKWIHLKFAAKVALSSGYFLYGQTFVKDVCQDRKSVV